MNTKEINNFLKLFLIFTLVLILLSCGNKIIYSKYKKINNDTWNYANKLAFEVNVKDTSKFYDVILQLRIKSLYPYSNLWLMISGKMPDGNEMFAQRYEFTLADEKGKWYGKGLGDIIDNEFLILQGLKFPVKGNYTFLINHDMRMNDLPEVMDVGISVKAAE